MSVAQRLVKLLLDENLSPWAAEQLRSAGHDAVHIRERDLLGASDPVVLERAYDEDRILVTSNVSDFEKLCLSVEMHAGVVLIEASGLLRTEQLDLLREIIEIVEGEVDLVNCALIVRSDGSHELRNLP